MSSVGFQHKLLEKRKFKWREVQSRQWPCRAWWSSSSLCGGRCKSECPIYSPESIPQGLRREGIYIYWGENISEIYIHYIFNKVHLSCLTVKCYGLCLFLTYILVQPLPLLSTPASLPLPIMPLWDHTTPLRGRWFNVYSVICKQQQRVRATWKL